MIARALERTVRQIPGYDPFAGADGCWFDADAAQHALDFFPDCLKHIEGAVAGKPFVLEPWQQAIVANLFGWRRKDRRGRVVRRYREAMIYVARKNGKTPLLAGIALYVFFADPEKGQQNYIAAADREQAGMLFRHAKGMVEQEPEMFSRCRIFGGNASAGQSRSIVRESDGSFIRVISADADTKHGGNPHCIIIDELHAQPNAELYDVLHTGMASENRAQPLFLSITTADYDRESVCNERYEYACGVRDGKIPDLTFLPVIYEVGRDEDWTQPEVWRKANPNLGVSVSEDYLEGECQKALRVPRLQNPFKRLHLNVRTRQDVLWLPMDKWEACAWETCRPGGFVLPPDLPIYGGLDLSSKFDLTALAWVWREHGKVWTKLRFWLPEERIRQLDIDEHDPRFRLWRDAGWIEATPGNVVDYEFIQSTIVRDAAACSVQQVGFDPWNATQTAVQLKERHGVEMVEVRQGFASLSEPAKELERLLTAEEFRHEGNPVLDWMAGNVEVRTDPAGNIKPVKPEHVQRGAQRKKVDGIVAIVIALNRLLASPPPKASYYETHELETW